MSGPAAKKTLLLAHPGFTPVFHGVAVPMDGAVKRDYGQTFTALQVP